MHLLHMRTKYQQPMACMCPPSVCATLHITSHHMLSCSQALHLAILDSMQTPYEWAIQVMDTLLDLFRAFHSFLWQ